MISLQLFNIKFQITIGKAFFGEINQFGLGSNKTN